MTSPTPGTGPVLDLRGDLVALFRAVCDVPSVSGEERALADAVEAALRALPHLEVVRDGDTVVARTTLGRERRVVVAGHLDTVPLTDPPNLPTRVVGEGAHAEVWGRGTVDMKGGVAVALALAAELDAPAQDVTWVFYDNEEVAADLNGLGRLARNRPDLLAADLAVLGSPPRRASRAGATGRCVPRCACRASPPTPRAPGRGPTRSMPRTRCSTAWPRTCPGTSRSTASCTGRG